MNKVTIHVGLDYHDSVVQVCVLDAAGKVLVNQTAANQATSLDQLVRRHGNDIQAEIGRFHSGKRFARFCALLPWNTSSGQRQADAGLTAR